MQAAEINRRNREAQEKADLKKLCENASPLSVTGATTAEEIATAIRKAVTCADLKAEQQQEAPAPKIQHVTADQPKYQVSDVPNDQCGNQSAYASGAGSYASASSGVIAGQPGGCSKTSGGRY